MLPQPGGYLQWLTAVPALLDGFAQEARVVGARCIAYEEQRGHVNEVRPATT